MKEASIMVSNGEFDPWILPSKPGTPIDSQRDPHSKIRVRYLTEPPRHLPLSGAVASRTMEPTIHTSNWKDTMCPLPAAHETVVKPRPPEVMMGIVHNGLESRCPVEPSKLDAVDQHLTAIQILDLGTHLVTSGFARGWRYSF